MCVCPRFSDQTTKPIWTNDGSMEWYGPWWCHDGPRIFKIPTRNWQKWPKMARIQSLLPLLTKLLDRYRQKMALWNRWDQDDLMTSPNFWKSGLKLAKIAPNGPGWELLAIIDQTAWPIDFKLSMIVEDYPRSDLSLFSIFWMTSVNRKWRHSTSLKTLLALLGRRIVRSSRNLEYIQTITHATH